MKKFMKRALTVVLTLALALSVTPTQYVQAQESNALLENTQTTETLPEAGSETESESTIANVLLKYVVVDQAKIDSPQTQNIVIGFENNVKSFAKASLKVTNVDTGDEYEYEASAITESAVKFSIDYTDSNTVGKFHLNSVTVETEQESETITLSDAGIDATYGVNEEVETKPDAYVVNDDESEITVENIDQDGNAEQAENLEDALNQAQDDMASEAASNDYGVALYSDSGRSSNVVVVLDPGHGGNDGGTSRIVNGVTLYERDINLKIAQYCKAELEQYAGVTVYMTRSDNTSPNIDRQQRAAFARDHGANVLVSIHINSADSRVANGAEVYYPNANYNGNISNQGNALGNSILNQLAALGLSNRGTKVKYSTDGEQYPDGSTADYYGINKWCKTYGFPGIIVEHAFLTNDSDATNHLMTDGQLQQLGIADATGIANYFGLSKEIHHIYGIYMQQTTTGIAAAVSWDKQDSGAQFRWMEYNVDKGQWKILSNWSGNQSVLWKPGPGHYWLSVDLLTSRGSQENFTTVVTNYNDYRGLYMEANGVYAQEQGDGVHAGLVHQTNDPNAKYRWLVYDLSRQNWRIISNWNSSEWVTWKPEPGHYWLRAEAQISDGTSYDCTIAYNVSNDYTGLTLYGIYAADTSNCVAAALSYSSQDSNTQFRWMSYDLQKGQWRILSDWGSSSSVAWKPEIGNHWLSVDVRTGAGAIKNFTITYTSNRDYTKPYMEMNGIYCKDGNDGISVGAVHQTNDPNAKYRWLYYNGDNGNWYNLSNWSSSEWATWKPDAGNYWLRAEARTSDGREYNYTITYTVDKYAIMGATTTSLTQMVNYFNANASYPYFYSNTDAPTIQAFCQIYLEECAAEGVKAEVAFCQAMKETGFLKFRGDVSISQYNFAGLGTVGGGVAGASFPNVRTGVRAQIQHLKAYASNQALNNPCVDPRFGYVSRDCAMYVEWLGQKENPTGKGWATAVDYGYSIRRDYMNKLKQF